MTAVLQGEVARKPHQKVITEQVLKRIQETPGHGRRAVRGGNPGIGLQKAGQDFRSQTCRGGNHGIQAENKEIKMESEERPGEKWARIEHGGRMNGLAERQTVGSTGSTPCTRKPRSKTQSWQGQGGGINVCQDRVCL